MRRADAKGGEPRLQFAVCTLTPSDFFKGVGRQTGSQLLHRDRLVIRRALQQPRWPTHLSSWLGGQRLFGRVPPRPPTLHSHHVLQFEFGERIAKLSVNTIGGVSQHHTARHSCFHSRPNLIHCNLRFGLKLNLFRHFGSFPPLGILHPFLG